jgi:hypothetical protein
MTVGCLDWVKMRSHGSACILKTRFGNSSREDREEDGRYHAAHVLDGAMDRSIFVEISADRLLGEESDAGAADDAKHGVSHE